jgi:DNA polymerase II small subunit/DNA polymerase delta subunit B
MGNAELDYIDGGEYVNQYKNLKILYCNNQIKELQTILRDRSVVVES